MKAKIFTFAVEDIGAWVTAAFLNPDTRKDKDMRIVTEWLSTLEMAKITSRVTRKKVVPEEAAFGARKNTKDPVVKELSNSKTFYN